MNKLKAKLIKIGKAAKASKAQPKKGRVPADRTTITLTVDDHRALSDLRKLVQDSGPPPSTSQVVRLALRFAHRGLADGKGVLNGLYEEILALDGRKARSSA